MEGLSPWQTALTVNMMQALLQAMGSALDGRVLCRMRATCRLWRALLERVPEVLMQAERDHMIHIDCLCHLDETLLAGFPGHAHSLRRIQPNVAWQLMINSFFHDANVRVNYVWPKFRTAVGWLQHMGVVGSPATRAAAQILTLVDSKTGDLFILIKKHFVVVFEENLPVLARLTDGLIRWRQIVFEKTVDTWDFNSRCDFAGLDLNRWFDNVRCLWALHIPMRRSGVYPHGTFTHPPNVPDARFAVLGMDGAWTDAERRWAAACADHDIRVKRAPAGSEAKPKKKRKKRKVDESDDDLVDDDDDDNYLDAYIDDE